MGADLERTSLPLWFVEAESFGDRCNSVEVPSGLDQLRRNVRATRHEPDLGLSE
jgi:hypothetical protein